MSEIAPSAVLRSEKIAREELAAAYRLIHHHGMADQISTHLTLRIQEDPQVFLINEYGLFFDEISASNLVSIDIDGNKITDSAAEVNAAGFTIHSAIHAARPDAHAVFHTHSLYGMAVAAQEQGLLPVNQISMDFYSTVGYHSYEGISLDLSERDRIAEALGDHNCLILRNHGLISVGRTVAEAFYHIYYLEKACQIQVMAQSGGAKLLLPSQEICDFSVKQTKATRVEEAWEEKIWKASIRMLDRMGSTYKN